jgi:hypothetical protein
MMTATSTEQRTDSSCAFLNRPPLRLRKVLVYVLVSFGFLGWYGGSIHRTVSIILDRFDLNFSPAHHELSGASTASVDVSPSPPALSHCLSSLGNFRSRKLRRMEGGQQWEQKRRSGQGEWGVAARISPFQYGVYYAERSRAPMPPVDEADSNGDETG